MDTQRTVWSSAAGVRSIGPDSAQPGHGHHAASSADGTRRHRHGSAGDDRRLTPLQEAQLLEQWRDGDAGALSELLEAYQRRIYSICVRMVRNAEDARDMTQDTLANVISGLETYDNRAKLSTWIYRITMNTCLNHIRRERLRRHTSIEEPASQAENHTIADSLTDERELSAKQRIEQRDLRASVARALQEVDPDARAMLVLRDIQDLDYDSISEVLDIPVGTVKSRLYRARKALATAIQIERDRQERDRD